MEGEAPGPDLGHSGADCRDKVSMRAASHRPGEHVVLQGSFLPSELSVELLLPGEDQGQGEHLAELWLRRKNY